MIWIHLKTPKNGGEIEMVAVQALKSMIRFAVATHKSKQIWVILILEETMDETLKDNMVLRMDNLRLVLTQSSIRGFVRRTKYQKTRTHICLCVQKIVKVLERHLPAKDQTGTVLP